MAEAQAETNTEPDAEPKTTPTPAKNEAAPHTDTRSPTRSRPVRKRHARQRARVTEGLPDPLGATWDGLGVNFALFSANATKVELCLFDARGERELDRVVLPEY